MTVFKKYFHNAINKISRCLEIALVFIIISTSSCSQLKKADLDNITVVFYNVENLFDIYNEPGKNDVEFTPDGKKKWDKERYQKKLSDISRVISGINKNDLPEIVGLCEVENEHVLKDLVKTGLLRKGKYSVIHYDSPDSRGIDCALIYRPAEFRVTDHFKIPIREKGKTRRTRDILYVKGKTVTGELFHIFVNHWPSRVGGVAKTEPQRISVARILKSKVDSVMIVNPGSHIIIMGDMNDEPVDKSLFEVMGAKHPADSGAKLVNLMFPEHENGKGSYNYRGSWDMLDNIIVSSGLLNSGGFRVTDSKGFVYRKPWMEYVNSKGDTVPDRTYGGHIYYGGVSDHFPVYFRMRRQ